MRCFHVNVRDLRQIRLTLLTNIATLLLEGCCPSIKVMDGLDGAHCVELCGHFYHLLTNKNLPLLGVKE